MSVAYIITLTTHDWRDALSAVRCAREVANPNLGFTHQLQKYQNEKVEKVRNIPDISEHFIPSDPPVSEHKRFIGFEYVSFTPAGIYMPLLLLLNKNCALSSVFNNPIQKHVYNWVDQN